MKGFAKWFAYIIITLIYIQTPDFPKIFFKLAFQDTNKNSRKIINNLAVNAMKTIGVSPAAASYH